ncbi:MAG: chorismate synthase [Dethiobacteria bacterium]|nr:chorismate synthase [Bacillota bacterium]
MRYLSGGESHGPSLTAVVEGLPAGLELYSKEIDHQLWRRQQGYGRGARMAIEKDRVEFLSGLRFNKTLGSPLTMIIRNRDWDNWKEKMAPEGKAPANLEKMTRPRPGHADLAGALKYNHDDLRNILERSSARETAMKVAVGSVARSLLEKFGIAFFSHVIRIGAVAAEVETGNLPSLAKKIEKSPVRCADSAAEKRMIEEIEKARIDGDTLGGIIELYITGLPPGLGSYVQPDRRLDGSLAGALMSIQAIKGIEIGAGFRSAQWRGSEVHDPIIKDKGTGINRSSNHAGGIEGGISNGQPLIIRLVMKPIPTLTNPLPSVDLLTGFTSPGAVERSDVCAVPAAAVVAEAVASWQIALAFREKFAGDYIEEVEAAYQFYMEKVNSRLQKS